MTIDGALKMLNARFVYKNDKYKYIDVWTVMHGDGKWEGDCEDYSITLMWLISNSNVFKFLWNILIFKHLMWFVKAPSGEGHAIVKIDGMYYDNIQRKATSEEDLKKKGYKFVFPMVFPFVYSKLLLSYTIGRLV